MQGFNISLYDAILASDVDTNQVNGMRLKEDRNISKLLLLTFAVMCSLSAQGIRQL